LEEEVPVAETREEKEDGGREQKEGREDVQEKKGDKIEGGKEVERPQPRNSKEGDFKNLSESSEILDDYSEIPAKLDSLLLSQGMTITLIRHPILPSSSLLALPIPPSFLHHPSCLSGQPPPGSVSLIPSRCSLIPPAALD
jgi:hypothetical protein